jgi:N4-gp56 family major capsid protein
MEIVTPAGIKMMATTLGYKFPLTGDNLSTSSGNVYATLVYGKEAYGVVGLAGMAAFKLTMKESGNQNTSDPNSLYKTVGFKFYTAAQVLNSSAGLWIVTTGL